MSHSVSTDRQLFKEVSIILIVKVLLLIGLWYVFFSGPADGHFTTEQVAERISGVATN